MLPDIKAMLIDGYKAGESKWPTYDGKELVRKNYITASEVGGCARSIWYAKHDDAPQKELPEGWGFFARGHNVEAWMVDTIAAAEKDGWLFSYVGKDQRSFYDEYRSGTPDGLASHVDHGHVLLEFKSIDPRTNIRNLPKANHISQVQQNASLVSKCLDIPINQGLIVYIDASDYSKVVSFEVDIDEDAALALQGKAIAIKAAETAKDLEPEGMFNGGCTFCDYGAECSALVGSPMPTKKAGAGMSVADLEMKLSNVNKNAAKGLFK